MNRGERREVNHRKWISKVKKLWNSWGKNIGIYLSAAKYKTFDEFEKSDEAHCFKNTSSCYKKDKLPETPRNKKVDVENLLDMHCGQCIRYDTDDCVFADSVNRSTDWFKIGCRDFIN